VLRDAIEVQPDHAGALYALGLSLMQSGDPSGASSAFQKVVRLEPENGQAAINFGIALFSAGQPDAAIGALRHAATIESAAAEAYFNLATAYVKRGDTKEAVQEYEKALALRPDREETVNQLAGYHLAEGRTADAVRVLRIGVEHHPDSVVYNNMLAMLLATSRSGGVRNGTEAVRFAERADALTGHQHVEVLGTLAAAYAELGEFDKAVETAGRAIAQAQAANRPKLVEELTAQRELYRVNEPYRAPKY
jgi:Flp pilus assembly protein TadD